MSKLATEKQMRYVRGLLKVASGSLLVTEAADISAKLEARTLTHEDCRNLIPRLKMLATPARIRHCYEGSLDSRELQHWHDAIAYEREVW